MPANWLVAAASVRALWRLPDAHDYHFQIFLLEHFPKAADFSVALPHPRSQKDCLQRSMFQPGTTAAPIEIDDAPSAYRWLRGGASRGCALLRRR